MFRPYYYKKQEYTYKKRSAYPSQVFANLRILFSYLGKPFAKLINNTRKFRVSNDYYRKVEFTDLDVVSKDLEANKKFNFLFASKVILSITLIITGMVMMASKVLVPVVSIYAKTNDYAPVISPITETEDVSISVKGKDYFNFEELSRRFISGVEYKQDEGIMYPEFLEEKESKDDNLPEYFYLTIPKLDINNALIKTNSVNFDPVNALGHYNGSCLPDESCNVFIFGHSTYIGSLNKYEKGDYRAIFARLGELTYGDEFYIDYGEERYHYIVELSKVQKPENVNPLEDPLPKSLGKFQSTVELFTCTPPGTTKYRLSVIGKLVK